MNGGGESVLRIPILSSRAVDGHERVAYWFPWGTPDGRYVGWCGHLRGDGERRWFDYLGPALDDPDRIARFSGPFGVPGADEEVR